MTPSELQDRILEKLSHGPYGPYVIATDIGEPPFRVTAELKELKRRRLVTERITRETHLFHLTASGVAHLAGHNQMRLV